MKVLQIITSLEIGGAEKLLVDSVPLYQRKGLSVDVLSLSDSDSPFRKRLMETSEGKIVTLTKKTVYNPLLVFKIMPYLRDYDLIHVHLFPALYWVVLAKWFSFSKVKLVYTEHSTNNKRRKNTIFKMIERIFYRGVSKIVTIAEEVDKNIKSHLQFKDCNFILIHNGVDISKNADAIPLGKDTFFSNEDFLLIQVSSFRYPKDQKTLIISLTYLPESVKLILVGEGQKKKDCEELVNSLGLQYRVRFLGVRSDVPELLKTADVVILSSIYEGLSLSSIEGMASGPFIASNVPGLREVVSGAGLLFEQGNSKELAHHILLLYQDEKYYHQIANRCLERAKKFDINCMVNKYITVYEKIT